MAKKVTQAPTNEYGEITGEPETRTVRGAGRTREIPWTRGPQTRWQKFKRAAVG